MNQEIAQILAAIPRMTYLESKILDAANQVIATGRASLTSEDAGILELLPRSDKDSPTVRQHAASVQLHQFPPLPIKSIEWCLAKECNYHFRIDES
jgi:hypothetical protein